MVRLFPKTGLTKLWTKIEENRQHLESESVRPISASRFEGLGYINILVESESLEAIQDFLIVKVNEILPLRKTQVLPLMSPMIFPVKEGVHYTLERYFAQIDIAPESYKTVYDKLLNTKFDNDTHANWLSYSFGKEDILLSVFSADRESTIELLRREIGDIPGVKYIEAHRAIKFMPMLNNEKYEKSREPFLFTHIPGQGGKLINPDIYQKYLEEESDSIVIVRLYPKRGHSNLWDEIKEKGQEFSGKGVKPLYATNTEGRAYITVIFEIKNFEALKDFLVDNIQTLKSVRETRTMLLLEPTYYLLPENHAKDLERYLVYLRVESPKTKAVKNSIEGMDWPETINKTYLSYSLGQYDIFLSVLAKSREELEHFAENNFDNLDGLVYYDISSQHQLHNIASKEDRRTHQMKYLNDADKQRLNS